MSKKIVDYKVHSKYDSRGDSEELFAKAIKSDLEDGWHLRGKLIYKRGRFIQVMVKYAIVAILAIIVIKIV